MTEMQKVNVIRRARAMGLVEVDKEILIKLGAEPEDVEEIKKRIEEGAE